MEFIGPRIVEKTIGTKYRVEWDKQEHTVSVYFKNDLTEKYKFDRLSKSLNFYAAIKLVKDISRLGDLYDKYQLDRF